MVGGAVLDVEAIEVVLNEVSKGELVDVLVASDIAVELELW